MSFNSPVEQHLRALIKEAILSGRTLDSERLHRRFPAHRNLIDELLPEGSVESPEAQELNGHHANFAEAAAAAELIDQQVLGWDASVDLPGNRHAPPKDLPPVPPKQQLDLEPSSLKEDLEVGHGAEVAEEAVQRPSSQEEPHHAAPQPEADQDDPEGIISRQDIHGILWHHGGGACSYAIEKERLAGENPATAYLKRARRLALADVPGVQTPEPPEEHGDYVLIRFKDAAYEPVRLPDTLAPVRGQSRHVLHVVAETATMLQALHQQGAAHGRIELDSIRVEAGTSRVQLATGLETGPGLDGGPLSEQQIADIRALGAILYRGLARDGSESTLAETLHRRDTQGLPPLSSRRPDLHPTLTRIVEQALAAGDRTQGYREIGTFADQLHRLLDLETGAVASMGGASNRRTILLWLLAAPALALLVWGIVSIMSGKGPDPRLALIRGAGEQQESGTTPSGDDNKEQKDHDGPANPNGK